ncbi:MAG: hypothetical protein M3Z83_10445 [Actinomycetota bacterium]|nr:hypothetical protein [Actinomycetota bacterium]
MRNMTAYLARGRRALRLLLLVVGVSVGWVVLGAGSASADDGLLGRALGSTVAAASDGVAHLTNPPLDAVVAALPTARGEHEGSAGSPTAPPSPRHLRPQAFPGSAVTGVQGAVNRAVALAEETVVPPVNSLSHTIIGLVDQVSETTGLDALTRPLGFDDLEAAADQTLHQTVPAVAISTGISQPPASLAVEAPSQAGPASDGLLSSSRTQHSSSPSRHGGLVTGVATPASSTQSPSSWVSPNGGSHPGALPGTTDAAAPGAPSGGSAPTTTPSTLTLATPRISTGLLPHDWAMPSTESPAPGNAPD